MNCKRLLLVRMMYLTGFAESFRQTCSREWGLNSSNKNFVKLRVKTRGLTRLTKSCFVLSPFSKTAWSGHKKVWSSLTRKELNSKGLIRRT